MLESYLCQIGFKEFEAKIYVELLKLGPQAASVIAKNTNINRTTSYAIFKSLMKKGVISIYKNNNIKYFVANDPNSIIGYLDRMVKLYEYHRKQFVNSVNKFRETIKIDSNVKKPITTFVEGYEGIKNILLSFLSHNKEVRICLAFENNLSDLMNRTILEIIKKFFNSERSIKLIIRKTESSQKIFEEYFTNKKIDQQLLVLENNEFQSMFKNDIFICDDKVLLLDMDKKSEYGIKLECAKLYEMHKNFFDLIFNKYST
jgi:sugar-specific transcriptional regulator TrmB